MAREKSQMHMCLMWIGVKSGISGIKVIVVLFFLFQ